MEAIYHVWLLSRKERTKFYLLLLRFLLAKDIIYETNNISRLRQLLKWKNRNIFCFRWAEYIHQAIEEKKKTEKEKYDSLLMRYFVLYIYDFKDFTCIKILFIWGRYEILTFLDYYHSAHKIKNNLENWGNQHCRIFFSWELTTGCKGEHLSLWI